MIKYHNDMMQRTDEWYAARCGNLTASEMKLLVTPTRKTASNEKSRAHIYELASQRVTKYVEPTYESFDMTRGREEEIEARIIYNGNYAPVLECGFVTNDEFGYVIGWSPDGLIGDDGLIEAKSRCQKYQFETICDYLPIQKIPHEFEVQVQTALMVSRRKWCDFISYGNGMPMVVIRVEPDLEIQRAIREAADVAEEQIVDKVAQYNEALGKHKLVKTVRKNRSDEIVV